MHASLFTLLAALGSTAFQVNAHPTQPSAPPPGKAIYMTSNNAENAIIALPIAANGMLLKGTSIATGGAGSNIISSTTNKSATPDALDSQSSITIAGNYLFAVNAGSNSVSMFVIDPANPADLTMVGEPVSVPGDFPNTVGASSRNMLVCVGTSGAKSGISCASFSEQGIGIMDALRVIELNQTTPPVGPLDTISQVFFSNDESTLFATVKGDGTTSDPGLLAAYTVEATGCNPASVSQQGQNSSPNGTAVLFGSSTIPESTNLFVTDASFGAVVLSINPITQVASTIGKGVIAGQKATCWATISPATKTAFVADVAVDRLVEMSLTDASIIGEPIDLSANGNPGYIDLRAAGNLVYALSPGNGTIPAAVTVVDVLARKQVQQFDLQALGGTANSEGMAILL